MNLKGIILSEKKSVSKIYILYDSIYMEFLDRQNHNSKEEINGCQDIQV